MSDLGNCQLRKASGGETVQKGRTEGWAKKGMSGRVRARDSSGVQLQNPQTSQLC